LQCGHTASCRIFHVVDLIARFIFDRRLWRHVVKNDFRGVIFDCWKNRIQ
jgi:hypothetical protein